MLLDRVCEIIPLPNEADGAAQLAAVQSEFPQGAGFDRDFASLCWAACKNDPWGGENGVSIDPPGGLVPIKQDNAQAPRMCQSINPLPLQLRVARKEFLRADYLCRQASKQP